MSTFLMQCLGCGTMVRDPRTMNYMYEKCDMCLKTHKEQEEKAIDMYLDQRAVQELENNAKSN